MFMWPFGALIVLEGPSWKDELRPSSSSRFVEKYLPKILRAYE